MSYNRECPVCGATLDPCERCDCIVEKENADENDKDNQN